MTDNIAQREIEAEQQFVDRVYVQLDRSANAAKELAREGHGRGMLGHEGGLVERDAMVYQAARRIAQLDAAHEGLVFGRLDLDEQVDAQPRYVGRIGLRDDEPRLAADRLAGAGCRGVLPGHRRRPARRRTPPGAALLRPEGRRVSRTSCSTPTTPPPRRCPSSARAP